MDAADIIANEEVHVWNIRRGTRLATYAIEAPGNNGVICANGAAAHLVQAGEFVVIATFQDLADTPKDYAPIIVRVDNDNRQFSKTSETAGPGFSSYVERTDTVEHSA
jgi:aspartate 1-decarboxylase